MRAVRVAPAGISPVRIHSVKFAVGLLARGISFEGEIKMRNVLFSCFWLVAVAAASAQDYPSECACAASRSEPTEVRVCSKNKPENCTNTVVVSLSDKGVCQAKLPYCVLCVRTKDTPDGSTYLPALKWSLSVDHAATYKFHKNAGVQIAKVDDGPLKIYFSHLQADESRLNFLATTGPTPTPVTAQLSDRIGHSPIVFPANRSDACSIPLSKTIIVNTDK